MNVDIDVVDDLVTRLRRIEWEPSQSSYDQLLTDAANMLLALAAEAMAARRAAQILASHLIPGYQEDR